MVKFEVYERNDFALALFVFDEKTNKVEYAHFNYEQDRELLIKDLKRIQAGENPIEEWVGNCGGCGGSNWEYGYEPQVLYEQWTDPDEETELVCNNNGVFRDNMSGELMEVFFKDEVKSWDELLEMQKMYDDTGFDSVEEQEAFMAIGNAILDHDRRLVIMRDPAILEKVDKAIKGLRSFTKDMGVRKVKSRIEKNCATITVISDRKVFYCDKPQEFANIAKLTDGLEVGTTDGNVIIAFDFVKLGTPIGLMEE